jgi:hypothetical protein
MTKSEFKGLAAVTSVVILFVVGSGYLNRASSGSTGPVAATDQTTPTAPPPPPQFVCELPQAWKEGAPMPAVRKAALAAITREWSAKPDVFKKLRCETNAKTDEQLSSEAKAAEAEAAAKAARDKLAAEAEAKRQREEAAAQEKREKEEAIATAKREREEAEQAKREAAQAVIDHAKEIRDGIKDGSIRVLSATDLSAQTHKWDGKKIITTLSCFYADSGDYRCVGGHLRIDFSSFEPDDVEEHFKNNCDTITKSQRKLCSLKLLFTYDSFDEMDTGGGFYGGKITVVKPQFGSGEVLSK